MKSDCYKSTPDKQTHKYKQSSRYGLNLSHIWQNTANSWSYKTIKPECSIKFAHPGSNQQSKLQVWYTHTTFQTRTWPLKLLVIQQCNLPGKPGALSPRPTILSPCWCSFYLALATETCLLQPGPDALDPPRVLWVAVCVSTGTLMFQHQGVIDKACSRSYKITLSEWSYFARYMEEKKSFFFSPFGVQHFAFSSILTRLTRSHRALRDDSPRCQERRWAAALKQNPSLQQPPPLEISTDKEKKWVTIITSGWGCESDRRRWQMTALVPVQCARAGTWFRRRLTYNSSAGYFNNCC